jgi:tetratricopeptide (TPR) repeat protein
MEYEERKSKVELLIKQDKYSDALIECSKMLMERPNDTQNAKRFRFLFERIIDGNKELQPETPVEFAMVGIAQMYSHNLQSAIENLTKAIKMDMRNDFYLKCRALSYTFVNEFDLAISDLEDAIRIKQEGEYFDDLANVYSTLGNFEVAMNCHEKAVRIAPDDARLWYNYGVDLLSCALFKEAVIKFERAIDLWPHYEDAKVNLDFAKRQLGEL